VNGVSLDSLWQGVVSDPSVRESAASSLECIASEARGGDARAIILAGVLAVVADLLGWGPLMRARARARAPAPCGCAETPSRVVPLRVRD
jgi:hypothetical protein